MLITGSNLISFELPRPLIRPLFVVWANGAPSGPPGLMAHDPDTFTRWEAGQQCPGLSHEPSWNTPARSSDGRTMMADNGTSTQGVVLELFSSVRFFLNPVSKPRSRDPSGQRMLYDHESTVSPKKAQ